ncbi:porin family protein [Tenacibaculum aiptasiae]|uniref:porin family protein n=1 Tax=Tenacibaculum aiptasiae TaxID=426481 RepID=UPI00232DC340|nr:porin family protein [Tenacibaculum aiptasiae]
MKNYIQVFFVLFLSISVYSQKDSLQIGDEYWEDQLYIDVTYNVLNNQPLEVAKSGFSFGFSGGYIKDIPLVKSGQIAIGVGLGYAFDSFNHSLNISETDRNVFEVNNTITANKLKTHAVEMPIQFRWRTSTAKTYSFWRVYTGVKLSYNFSNVFRYNNAAGTTVSFSNISQFNKFQAGLILSAGYGTFNFHAYYGLTSMFKNAVLNGNPINTKVIKFGLSFYLL